MHALDAIDRKILSLLQSDSRMTMQELADKVGLSVSPCHRRVKLLEERGVITRYIGALSWTWVGLSHSHRRQIRQRNSASSHPIQGTNRTRISVSK